MQVHPDVAFTSQGSIVTIRALTPAGRDWIDDNVTSEGWQWLGDALCSEPCLAVDIHQAMQADGLICA